MYGYYISINIYLKKSLCFYTNLSNLNTIHILECTRVQPRELVTRVEHVTRQTSRGRAMQRDAARATGDANRRAQRGQHEASRAGDRNRRVAFATNSRCRRRGRAR